jgi:hypothetical protein
MDSLASKPLSDYSKSSTDLLFGAPDSDMALPKGGTIPFLDREGSHSSAGYVGDLLEAASLSSDDVTCAGVRSDASHGELVCGRHSLRKVLSKGEC